MHNYNAQCCNVQCVVSMPKITRYPDTPDIQKSRYPDIQNIQNPQISIFMIIDDHTALAVRSKGVCCVLICDNFPCIWRIIGYSVLSMIIDCNTRSVRPKVIRPFQSVDTIALYPLKTFAYSTAKMYLCVAKYIQPLSYSRYGL